MDKITGKKYALTDVWNAGRNDRSAVLHERRAAAVYAVGNTSSESRKRAGKESAPCADFAGRAEFFYRVQCFRPRSFCRRFGK